MVKNMYKPAGLEKISPVEKIFLISESNVGLQMSGFKILLFTVETTSSWV